jgi:hypothetical protein
MPNDGRRAAGGGRAGERAALAEQGVERRRIKPRLGCSLLPWLGHLNSY